MSTRRASSRTLESGCGRIEVDPDRLGPYRHQDGVTILPINTTPDHEHLFHGGQTEETIPPARRSQYYVADAWRERVVQETETIVGRGGVATILAHPLCMKVVDDWRTFERLCSELSGYPSAWATETAESAPEGTETQAASDTQ